MPRARQPKRAETYRHDEEALLRPEVGTQAAFRKRKPPKTYRYDSSLSPALDWDGSNHARELGEWLIAQIEEASVLEPPFVFDEPRRFGDVEVAGLHDAVARLKALSRPFLDWAGKAERLSFDVPTLPLFVHERLSTKAILETLTGHKRDRQMELQLFADPQLSLAQQLEAYEHRGGWVNRMILGDSLVVMNSLLEYEGLGGQVQMIYIDPPYGVKFGSNFQPFVRKRDVRDGDDASFTREPEMVKAYRDTWELGLHSYLSYLRDRLLVARELLAPSGSVFVQISDENLHHVRELMDDVFGESNFCAEIAFAKTSGRTPRLLSQVSDYIVWYAMDRERTRYSQLFEPRPPIDNPYERYICVETPGGEIIDLSIAQKLGIDPIPEGRLLRLQQASSQGESPGDRQQPVAYDGRDFYPPRGRHWSVTAAGMQRVVDKDRAFAVGTTLTWKSYRDEFPYRAIADNWVGGIGASGFGGSLLYVVQTIPEVVQRCVLMTTDPGDLVLDPTCGSGTTAFVAEQWGRRWITIDTSRVPLALARQRLLTATFPYYELQDAARGPAGGFTYKRKQNAKGEEVGGIVPHVTLKSIANDEPPKEEVLVDRPEVDSKITRVTGPFVVEATIPTPLETDEEEADEAQAVPEGSYADRMLEALRRSPVIQLPGNKQIAMKSIRPPARSLSFSAEAALEPDGQPVAIVFGPENGAVGERLVSEAVREAYAKSYEQLLVIGFAIEPNAREFVDKAEQLVGIPVTYVQATPDLVMGDLLKTMRSSQIFSVTGLPDVAVRKVAAEAPGEPERFEVELRGLDVFDPSDMSVDHRSGDDVPAWLLDTDYNGMVFHVSQAFFPRTGAWDSLRRSLKGELEDSVWEHLAGTTSAPFEAGDNGEIAVKVIDDRGNELLVVKKLAEAQ
ncbi:MAG: site-specific DNA-methyltransferase [Gaiella sp.]|nr:site-specific DNA-methyltransferase [Gaiella sp.]